MGTSWNLYKVSGAKNTFYGMLVLENPAWDKKDLNFKSEFVKKICGNNNLQEPVDGFFVLKEISPQHLAWDFYNSDGSQAEMCGNASRCAALLYWEKIRPTNQGTIKVETIVGPFFASRVAADMVTTLMPKPVQLVQMLEEHYYVNSGVPHLVIEGAPNKAFALQIRNNPEVFPNGTNVTFFEYLQEKQDSFNFKIQAVTFERGVDDFTQACGTGACAAAYAAIFKKNQTNLSVIEKNVSYKVIVEMPGGELVVEFDDLNKAPRLTGPAIIETKFIYNHKEII